MADTAHHYTGSVLAHVTMPRFRCHASTRQTCVYHSHDGSLTSHGWVDKAFGDA